MVITIYCQKGGCGKSTIAVNLALLTANNHKVLLVDTDPQASAYDMLADREEGNLRVVQARPGTEVDLVSDVMDDYEYVFVDTPPRADKLFDSLLDITNLLLMPLTPSPVDARALIYTNTLFDAYLKRENAYKDNLEACIIVNRLDPRTRIAQDVGCFLKRNFQLPVCKTMLHNRAVYGQCGIEGKSVVELEKSGPAAAEMKKLQREVIKRANRIGEDNG